ncbi:MAG: PPC domain-containing protein [Bryobacterales bacterium]|nr:PPC domain-containing protein [Bryobacterales bacterium]
MHKGKLTVVKADEDEDWRHDKAELTGWEIPVFLSVASSHGAAALDQWSGLEVTSSPSNGEFYRAGERIALRVDLAVPIELSEDPTLALQIGNRIRQAVLSSTSVSVCSEGAKKESLYFLYEVIPQDLDPDGISIAADALTFGEGRIQPAGNVVPFENDTRHKVDGSIARSDDHGDSLSDATELVLGRPAGGEIEVPGDADVFRLELAAAAAVRVFTSGGLDTVGALESQSGGNLGLDDDGGEGNNFLIETALEAGAYYVRVEAYGDATGTYTLHANSVPDDHGDSRSDATELALGRPAGGEIEVPGDADVFRLELAAAAAVRVFTSGGLDTVGALESQSGGNLGLDDDGGEGNNFLIETALEAGAYYVRVEAYGDATGTYTVHANSVPDDQVDGTKAVHPAINGVHIQTRPQDGQAYGLGEVISVTVSFDRDIEVTGSPTLVLGLGQSARQVSLSGTSPYGLWFRYEVQAGDRDADGISILPGALALSGGGIRSAAGTDAQLDLGGHAIENHPEQRVDGSKVAPPSVNRVSIYSRPADGRFYGAGEVIDVSIWFSQHIEVNGSPTLALGVGQGLRHASFYGTSPSGLWFRYQVRAGDVDTDGISILPSALALNGGSIRGASGLDADLNIGGHAIENDPAHKVDGGT